VRAKLPKVNKLAAARYIQAEDKDSQQPVEKTKKQQFNPMADERFKVIKPHLIFR